MGNYIGRTLRTSLSILTLCGWTAAALAVSNPHAWDVVGVASDPGGFPVLHGSVSTRIYDGPGAGANLIDTRTSTITGGLFDLTIGMSPPLTLDDSSIYYFELDVDGDEVIGDANGARLPFRPGGGDHSRPDLEARLDSLDAALGVSKMTTLRISPGGLKLPTDYAVLAGVLGIGYLKGSVIAYEVEADMLLQPVGVYSSSLHGVELGPFHVPRAGIAAGLEPESPPTNWALYPCEPNPFSGSTRIRYDVPATGGAASLRIFDLSGRLIRTLSQAENQPGRRAAVWRGDDDRGRPVGSGVYVCLMRAEGYKHTTRLTLIR